MKPFTLLRTSATALVALSLAAAHVHAQCSTWSSGLGPPGFRTASAIASFDAGAGERLYIATLRDLFDPVGRIHAWDGHGTTIVLESLPTRTGFDTLSSGDTGAGARLYATEIAGTGSFPPHLVYEFDGATWTQIGLAGGQMYGSGVYDDGTGPAFYLHGTVNGIDATPISKIGKWTGASWIDYGSGLTAPGVIVTALASFDDGTGTRLYAATSSFAGVTTFSKWTGTTWVPVVATLTGSANALAVQDFGAGPRLCIGGNLSDNGTPRHFVAWDGTTLTALPDPGAIVQMLRSTNFGQGPEICLGTTSAPFFHRFDGTQLTPVTGLSAAPSRATTFHDADGERIFVQGTFTHVDGRDSAHVAGFDGASWSRIGAGFVGTGRTLTTFDMGQGEQLFGCGQAFAVLPGSPGVPGSDIGRWTGTEWVRLPAVNPNTMEIAVVHGADVGTGPYLYAGAIFSGNPSLMRWNGATWSTVGTTTQLNGEVRAFATYDAGTGPKLIVGGNFAAVPSPGNRITSWDGTNFTALGSGTNNIVAALAVGDLGAGATLFAGGTFTTAGGAPASRVASWDGSTWSALGSGLDGPVSALCVHDDGSGPALFAGGSFTLAGGTLVSNLARWDGANWHDVGGGTNGLVGALAVHDDGRGAALYVGGAFDLAGGATAYNLARWKNGAFEAVDGGTNGYVSSLVSLDDDGDGDRELFAAGEFDALRDFASQGFARLAGGPHYTSFCFGDGSLADHTTACPCGNDGAAGHGCASGANAGGALLAASGSTQTDDVVLAGSGFPSSAYGLYLQHDAQDDRVFHDGVLCAGGNLLRLRNRNASGGASQFPDPAFAQDATTTLAQRGLVTPGSGATRYYSVFYRSPAATFCPPATANVTNGLRILW